MRLPMAWAFTEVMVSWPLSPPVAPCGRGFRTGTQGYAPVDGAAARWKGHAACSHGEGMLGE